MGRTRTQSHLQGRWLGWVINSVEFYDDVVVCVLKVFLGPQSNIIDPVQGTSATATVTSAQEVADEDNDGITCTICYDQFTNSGEHRISCLRCGHVYGKVSLLDLEIFVEQLINIL